MAPVTTSTTSSDRILRSRLTLNPPRRLIEQLGSDQHKPSPRKSTDKPKKAAKTPFSSRGNKKEANKGDKNRNKRKAKISKKAIVARYTITPECLQELQSHNSDNINGSQGFLAAKLQQLGDGEESPAEGIEITMTVSKEFEFLKWTKNMDLKDTDFAAKEAQEAHDELVESLERPPTFDAATQEPEAPGASAPINVDAATQAPEESEAYTDYRYEDQEGSVYSEERESPAWITRGFTAINQPNPSLSMGPVAASQQQQGSLSLQESDAALRQRQESEDPALSLDGLDITSNVGSQYGQESAAPAARLHSISSILNSPPLNSN
ncbi:hypothetical protein FPQ18DRAFT_380363 [Pyronema domesticum]|nr:hypothetical protein FPQ18DRAFT_380363 [Pyronema domesticum]